MIKKKGEAAAAAVFLLLIFAFAIAGAVLPDRAFSPRENRFLAQWPAAGLRDIRSAAYMKAVEEYTADQFPGRDRWVSYKAAFQKITGRQENRGVFFAKDGYLIGRPQTPPAEIAGGNLASVLALEAAGYDVALLVSPMAAEILRDKLPALAYAPVQADLIGRLRRDAPGLFVDVGPGLARAAAEGRQVFYRTDHHWTMQGAYQAYLAYMDWLGEAARPLDSYTEEIVSRDFYGSLWSKNSLPGLPPDEIRIFLPPDDKMNTMYEVEYFDGSNVWTLSSVYQEEYLGQKDQYAYFLGQNRPLAVIRRLGEPATAAPPRKLLIFKDSYAHSFAPFLLPHFQEIHLADLRYWKQDPIEYMSERDIRQVLFLYDADDFGGDRSISLIGAWLEQKANKDETIQFQE